MKTLIFENPDSEDIKKASQIIRSGGLVVFPTETVYGLGASALDPEGAKKIYLAKGRPSDNPLIIHLSKASEAENYCETNEIYYKLAECFMPGPITVIMPKKDIIPYEVTGGLDTVAVRVPMNDIALELIRMSGVPIAAPSANISGIGFPAYFTISASRSVKGRQSFSARSFPTVDFPDAGIPERTIFSLEARISAKMRSVTVGSMLSSMNFSAAATACATSI